MFEEILKKYWGYNTFRPLQKEIIESVYKGKDTLALMPTGGGKSITYQIPTMAMDGICVVVTPLISLMKDQVDSLRKRGITALCIHSAMTQREIDTALDNCIYGDYKFLYISPERINNSLLKHRFSKMNVCLLAVDEAHCISQWGYDFRPSYAKIAELRKLQPDVTVLAVTATATPQVAEDIMSKLLFSEPSIFKMSFARKNISYIKRETADKEAQILNIINSVVGCGIIYVRYRDDAEHLAIHLQANDILAESYHGGMSNKMRTLKQENFMKNKYRIMVATNAFGMGIDKSDVRFVIHYSPPESIESYYQEAGRVGRDGKDSFAIMLYNSNDTRTLLNMATALFPPIKEIKECYDNILSSLGIAIGDGDGYSYDFKINEYCVKNKIYPNRVKNALDLLQYNGYLTVSEEYENPTRIMFKVSRHELYSLQLRHRELESIINILLRVYTGIFSEYTLIDEEYLSKISGYKVEQINDMFKALWRQRIITYIPKKKSPRITLHSERLDVSNLRITPESYALRRERIERKTSSVIKFIKDDNSCISSYMRIYFGEEDVEDCGRCSYCRDQKKQSKC